MVSYHFSQISAWLRAVAPPARSFVTLGNEVSSWACQNCVSPKSKEAQSGGLKDPTGNKIKYLYLVHGLCVVYFEFLGSF